MGARGLTPLLRLGMTGFALSAARLPDFRALWGLPYTEVGWIGGGFFLGCVATVTDLAGLEELQCEFGALGDELAKVIGYDIEFQPVTNRSAVL
ncbi:phosphate/phosphonate-binding periplasmic protein [Azotobacter vinelandii CA]|uniref:Phosphate/phosphonate-binding periplasmic protein n=2 Tax=Azotobacter vinelandii TaxID=354 RepID=C1DLT1_AZOVD|nr:phosphate/phosphonate-binding periplasmic protein [Azotobacter vinelandii]ACO77029.1 phosphate/phosphonate-binding periplasmic protein [Azotobacter vinelandii DJ]AGK15514.1 phosphate/phosphonate-binding periplasmic protein [Azotobacter vinelandii CA]AGK19514.1 phosphate/phosphonate-binding periplasmic protein [Azotobacter vinelandii CA6]SFX39178.1 hypothetical protein SAMN04244547_01369 [Azotobacter vinelandii]GLK59180.1 hypothetical protein GCM10017624_13370 [Azotobacter vinelandii]